MANASGPASQGVIAGDFEHKASGVHYRVSAADGQVWLNTTQLPADQLAPKVKDMLTNRLDKMCYVRADSRARYEKVVDVVNNLRAAGVDQLGLLTEQVAPSNAPAAPASD